MREFLLNLEKVLLVLSSIFFAVFFLILLMRLVLSFLIDQAYLRYKKLKKIGKKIFASKKNFPKEDEELLRKKLKIPRSHSQMKAEAKLNLQSQSENYELITSEEQRQEKEEMNRISIVDVVKPVGFWTSMILGQKLTYLIQSAQIINKREQKGFWVSMIEAKDRSAGRQHGRGK